MKYDTKFLFNFMTLGIVLVAGGGGLLASSDVVNADIDWEPQINFDYQGGQGSEESRRISCTQNDSGTTYFFGSNPLPDATKEGYTFMGWGDDPDNPTWIMEAGSSGEIFVPTFSATLYAIWAPEVSDLVFASNPIVDGTITWAGNIHNVSVGS